MRNIAAGKRQARSGPQRNAPSRLRLRPAFRLTAAEAAADRRTINLGCSVLGAWLTLGGLERSVKALEVTPSANCAFFFSHRVALRIEVAALPVREKKKGPSAEARPKEFAEPGTLSSTFPTNLPLPRSAPRGASSYRRPVLGAGRNLRHGNCPIKGVRCTKFAQFALKLSRSSPKTRRAPMLRRLERARRSPS